MIYAWFYLVVFFCACFFAQFFIAVIKLGTDDFTTKKQFLFFLIPLHPFVVFMYREFKDLE